MTNIVSLSHQQFTPSQIEIIKKSVAPDTNSDELNLFLETAKLYGLNPFTKQISARIYSKNDAAKRSMAIIVQIDGFRAIAARQGNYRPDDDEPVFHYDESLKCDANPLGIERVVVKVFRMDSNGDWQTIKQPAYWDEYAPTEDEWAYNPDKGKREPTGKKTLSKTWQKMPRLMIAKCAEAAALRKGWPEAFSGLYSPEETDRADFEGTPSEILEQAQAEKRMKLVGGGKDDLPLQFEANGDIEMIPVGRFFDNVESHLNEVQSLDELDGFRARNKAALQRFWAAHQTDALELKKLMERRADALNINQGNDA
jgi:phage recombination protein Bet